MSNELTLILKTPVEELVPKMLAWNNSELLARVEETLKQYEGVTYDDESIDLAKKDRAQLNAFSKALNDERIRIGKIYNSPYDKFKSEVDEVIHKVKEVSDRINIQVNDYELRKQERKQNSMIEYYKEVVGEFSGLIPYERIHQAKWLNVSTSMKSIKTEIDNVIANARTAIVAIEGLKSEDESILKAFYFRTLNLPEALMENERLKQERQKIAEIAAKQVVPEAEEVKPKEISETLQEEVKIVKFQVEGSIAQLKLLQQFLRDNKIKFTAIKEDK